LAATSGLPTRTIREYQTLGLLPPPERRGRTGAYRPMHLHRLQVIGRLQQRGYSLAGIRDLLESWRGGADLTDVLGLSPDELLHMDEPGAPATLEQLTTILPTFVPDRLDEIVAVGLVEICGPDRYCVPSPSILQLTVDLLDAGYPADQLLDFLRVLHEATSRVADAALTALANPPAGLAAEALDRIASRGRGLLAHGVGRLTIHNLGTRLGVDGPGRRTSRA